MNKNKCYEDNKDYYVKISKIKYKTNDSSHLINRSYRNIIYKKKKKAILKGFLMKCNLFN